MYEKAKSETEARNQHLEETLDVSEKFWDDLNGLLNTLKDLQDTLAIQDPPALEPRAIREQQEALEVCTSGVVELAFLKKVWMPLHYSHQVTFIF